MLLPIIDSFIREVNNLAGDPSSPSFDEELSSCLFVMANETNPIDLGCKFFMLNISLSVLRKILAYLTILKLRSDSLRSANGEPINQAALTLALQGIVYAIGREEEPIDGWKIIRESQPTAMETSSGDENSSEQTSRHHLNFPPRVFPTPTRSVRQTYSSRSSRNSTDSSRSMTGPRPGTSRQSNVYRKSPNRSESGASDESTPGKQARGLSTPTRAGYHSAGRRGRTSSISSTSSVSPLSAPSGPSPSAESRIDPLRLSPSPSVSTVPIRPPVIQKTEPMIINPDPSTSNVPTSPLSSFTLSSLSAPSSSTSTSTPSPDEPTYGLLIVTSALTYPIQQGLIQVLEPFKDRIETTPICANHVFIKLKCKKDIYFVKRQIEILTRIHPRIVVTKFSRYSLDVPKQLAPTIKEFVNLNVSILKGEYYVYSRISFSDENLTTMEILASSDCQQSIENSSCLLKIGQETRQVVPIGIYQECTRCFFCYDDTHTECSQAILMEMEGLI